MNSKLEGLFKSIFNGTSIKLMENTDPNLYQSSVSGMKMTIYWGSAPSYEHICHEFGHIMDSVYDELPTEVLKNSTINDENGAFVMGERNVDGTMKYDRQPGLGYSPPCRSTTVACSTEQHPIDWRGNVGDGNNGDEEWGELFMNYMTGGFDLDSAPGRKRMEWTSVMINFLVSPPDYQPY